MTGGWWTSLNVTSDTTVVPILQFANDGRWETACAVPISVEPRFLDSVVHDVAARATRDIAVEVLWPGHFFVGARWDRTAVPDVVAAVNRARAVLEAPTSDPLGAAMEALLNRPPTRAPDFAELGAVNAWNTTTPMVL